MSKTKRHIQTIGEEIANSISHGVGSLLSIAGTVVLIVFAALYSDALAVVSASLYGATLIILYTNSTLYHALTNKTAKKVFRVFDHCSIFMLILGTYIPVSLSLLRNWIGWTLFGINIGCAVLGIVFNSINLEKFSKLSLLLYIIMGWSVLITLVPVLKAILAQGVGGLILLVSGGILYTVGIIFYKSNKKYMHFIWHFFVLGGSITHYFFVMFYCM
ncbi:MAG: hemolysin III family protein [Clostridia bacterium]|nr:hemolysin III family protein [Clostridia bacterium]